MLIVVQFGQPAKLSPPSLTRSTLALLDGAHDDTSTESASSSGSSTPTPPRGSSPSPPSETENYPPKPFNPPIARSPSPLPRAGAGLGIHHASPLTFGYPYRPSTNSLFSEASAS